MIREEPVTVSSSLSYRELRDIVAEASTVAERLNGGFLVDDTPDSEDLRQQQLDTWCRIAAVGDWKRFQEVLSWDGYDITDVQRVLGHVRLREHAPLPAWTTTLQEVLHLVETMPCEHGVVDKNSWSFLAPDRPSPFEELLSPFVVVAQQRYTQQAGSAYHLLSAEAHSRLQRHLLQVLTSLSVDTLYSAFSHWRSHGEYQQFIEWMYQGGWIAFLRTYSFLARLLATTTDLWIEAHIEFLHRLEADWQEIQRAFGGNTALGQVTAIEPALSNPHHDRRCVMALTFAEGTRLVYKPRNIGIEVYYYRFLNWCNEHGATPPFKVLTAIDRSTYGWVEFVEQKPCQDQQAVECYYRRAGMLLCLTYVLGGVDCFYECIIAHGEHPILIDPTVLLHHYACPDYRDEPFQKQCSDWEQQTFSVLHTGLLASWQTTTDAKQLSSSRDISGLAMNGTEKRAPQRQTQSQCPALKYGMLRTREHLNIPLYEDTTPPATAYSEAISTGFTQLYQLLLSHRGELLGSDGALQPLGQQIVRVLFRENLAYQTLLSKLFQPQYLRDSVAYSIELERLWHSVVPVEYTLWREANSAHWRRVWQAEQRALLWGDIPFFTALARSNILHTDQPLESCLHQPGFDLLLKRVEQLSESDMHRQLGLIQAALSRSITPVRLNVAPSGAAHNTPDAGEDPTSAVLLAQALAIADTIAEQAIPSGKKATTWLHPQGFMRSSRQQLQSVRYSLFNGASGIALFLAAVAKISAEPRYDTLARAAVWSLCRSLHECGEATAREMGIGGAVGLGGVVYALTHLSRFLNDPIYLTTAREAARFISSECIANDQALDIIAGSAGAILGLLALYQASQDQEVLDRAIACGRHLLQRCTMSKAGCLAWPTLGGKHTTGFSHGTAGIVCALLRLYTITGDINLLNAAQEGLIYEDHAFVSEAGNWAEILTDSQPEYRTSWCHGAPGIGLARIGGLPVLDNVRIRQDIEVALQTTQQVNVQGIDHLCCGNSGRAEILLTAAQKLARPELADMARRNMWSILTRAEQRKTFLVNPSLPPWVSSLTFFQGTSGIGYTLLRVVYPDAFPSVLLWE